MRILMTTGIFEPESGGPATLTPKIAERLVADGHTVTVITYSDKPSYDFDAKYSFNLVRVVRRGSRLRNYAAFLRATLRHMPGVDITYSLDWLAAGLPVVIAAAVYRVPVMIRVGGDYVWERYLETGAEPMPATDFYAKNLHSRFRLMYTLIRFVLQRANHVVFNSDIQREMYYTYYGLTPERTGVIYNPVPKSGWEGIERGEPNTELVFAGRIVAQKNVGMLVRAFAQATLPPEYRLLIIGDGPEKKNVEHLAGELGLGVRVEFLSGMRQKELYERIRNCRALILTSWTDQSPNQVFEAMQLKIPMIVTKENYLAIRDALPLSVDPRSAGDIARALERVADDAAYTELVEKWGKLSFDYDWDREMKEHYAAFEIARAR